MKTVIFWICVYLVLVALTLVSEVTFKKRTWAEVRKDFLRILSRTAVIFGFFTVSAYAWQLFSPK